MTSSGSPDPGLSTSAAQELAEELRLTPEGYELVAGLLRFGATPEQIREAAAEGRLEEAVFDAVLDPERERRTVSAAEIEADGGLPAAEIQATLQGFGLTPPGAEDAYFTPEEAVVFRELGRLEEVWPPDVRQEVSRVYGQALGRIAQTELHLFRTRVEPLLREVTESPLDTVSAARQVFQWLLPLIDPMLVGVHRRKLEHEMTQAAVWEVESEAAGRVPGTVKVSLLFLDLRHFTSFANRYGDATAIEVVGRLGTAISENLGETGRLVKQLGDGCMLAYPDPEDAVAAALAIARAARDDAGPSLHAGLHHGRVVFRDGDYFGRGVNLAARLLSIAKDDELLATAGVVEESVGRDWESRGERTLLGFETPIEVYALDLNA